MLPIWFIYLALTLLILFFFTSSFVLGILYWHSHTKDDYRKLYVFKENGKHTNNYKGKLETENSDGIVYLYKVDNDIEKITVPHNYGFTYWRHRRKVDIDSKNRLVLHNDSYRVKQHDYDMIIKSLTIGKIGADIVNAVKSHKAKVGTIVMVAVIAFVIGIGVILGYNYYTNRQQAINKPPTTQQQTIPPTIKQGE